MFLGDLVAPEIYRLKLWDEAVHVRVVVRTCESTHQSGAGKQEEGGGGEGAAPGPGGGGGTLCWV